MKIILTLLLMTLPVLARAQDHEATCRKHLKHLGGAMIGYGILHENKRPAKLSDLYTDGLIDNLSDFVCPASGATITMASDIDAKGDYTLEALPDAKDMIVREKNPRHGTNTVLAIFADNSIKALPAPAGSTAAATPTTSSPTPAAKTSPPIQSSPTADSGMVVVPNLALFDSVAKMKAALESNGLVGTFSAKGKPASKALEFKFASQLPLADTKVKSGSKVEVFIYQKFEEATPATGQGEEVLVPNLAQFDSVSKMKAALERVGLVGNFSAKGKPPSKALEFKFASQLPLADTKAKPGSKVEVFIYQKFEEATTGVTGTPSTAASATPATGEEVLVPNLAQFDTVSKMKAALERVGLKGHFSAKGKPPSRELEFKFASQLPLAETKAKRGSTVVVSIYQKFEETSGPPTTYSPSSSSPAARATPAPASSTAWARRESGDPTSNLEGAKWMGSWRGKVMRTGEPIAGGGTGDYEDLTLIRRVDGSDVWIYGSSPLFYYEVANGKMRFKTKDISPPRYTELEQRGDHWAGRWVEGDRVLATFDLAPIPRPNWLKNF